MMLVTLTFVVLSERFSFWNFEQKIWVDTILSNSFDSDVLILEKQSLNYSRRDVYNAGGPDDVHTQTGSEPIT